MSHEESIKKRSKFWIKIHDNEDSGFVIATSDKLSRIINQKFPTLPNNWGLAKNNNSLSLKVPHSAKEIIEEIRSWEEKCKKCIWVEPNSHITKSFDSEELLYCIAYDFNFSFDTTERERTSVGEAEYQLKYCFDNLSEDERCGYLKIITDALEYTVSLLPYNPQNTLITTIPSEKSATGKKLPDKMVSFLVEKYKYKQLVATVAKKPAIKELSTSDKIQVWKNIYSNNSVSLSENVKGKDILIIDDLYQSGTSMWTYAEYLKKEGAHHIMGVTAVKSQRDSDNK